MAIQIHCLWDCYHGDKWVEAGDRVQPLVSRPYDRPRPGWRPSSLVSKRLYSGERHVDPWIEEVKPNVRSWSRSYSSSCGSETCPLDWIAGKSFGW